MIRNGLSLAEIRREGIEALLDRLGPVGTIRFFQQYETGTGNYTEERHRWLDGLSVKEIVERIEKRRSRPS